MADELTLHIKNTLASAHSANEKASHWLSHRGVPPDVHYFANLAIEELVTNCIKYGFDDSNEHTIEVKLSVSGGALAITVTDDGHPFNPLDLAEPDLDIPPEERPIGGLGIYLLRRMSDRMDYVRQDGKNRITLQRGPRGEPQGPGR